MARACGHHQLSDFTVDDLAAWDREMALLSGIKYSGVGPITSRAPLNNAVDSQAYRQVRHRDVTLQAYARTPKSENEEGGLACMPLRAGPKAFSCELTALFRGALDLAAQISICPAQSFGQ